MTSTEAPNERGSLGLRVTLALVPCLLGLFIAAEYLSFMTSPQTLASPFADAWTYQAAGERLNAGHDLYRLVPGDRPVLEVPGLHAPLLSPPPIAVVWRPIAWLPFGFDAWVIACWMAVLGTTFFLVMRTGIRGAIVASLLAPAIGEQLAACNVAAFFPLLMVVAWKARQSELGGVSVGVMAAVKLTPASLVGWLVGGRFWRALVGFVIAVSVILIVTILGAGIGSFSAYLDVARTTSPSTSSLSGLTGIGWLSPAFLVAGTLLAAALGRWPRISFVVGVVVAVVGTPALYLSGLVTLLATLAPFSDLPAAPGRSCRRKTTEVLAVPSAGCTHAPGVPSFQPDAELDQAPNVPVVAVVIPALNEAGKIGRVLDRFPRDGRFEAIVVDDGSSDGTGDEARAHGADLVIRHDVRGGVGAAIRDGWTGRNRARTARISP